MAEETKKWWQSKTIWSDVITILVSIVMLVDQHFGTNIAGEKVYGFIISILGMLGIYGRAKSDTKIENVI